MNVTKPTRTKEAFAYLKATGDARLSELVAAAGIMPRWRRHLRRLLLLKPGVSEARGDRLKYEDPDQ